MTNDEAIKLLKMSDQAIWLKGLEKEQNEAIEMAIKSLEAWEKVKEELKAKRNEYSDCGLVGSALGISRSMDIIDKHLKEVSE